MKGHYEVFQALKCLNTRIMLAKVCRSLHCLHWVGNIWIVIVLILSDLSMQIMETMLLFLNQFSQTSIVKKVIRCSDATCSWFPQNKIWLKKPKRNQMGKVI